MVLFKSIFIIFKFRLVGYAKKYFCFNLYHIPIQNIEKIRKKMIIKEVVNFLEHVQWNTYNLSFLLLGMLITKTFSIFCVIVLSFTFISYADNET